MASKLFTAAIRPLQLGQTLSAGWDGSVGLEPAISRCFLRRSLAASAASDVGYRFSSADARRDAKAGGHQDAACASRRQSPHLEHREAQTSGQQQACEQSRRQQPTGSFHVLRLPNFRRFAAQLRLH